MLSGAARTFTLLLHPSLTLSDPVVQCFIERLREGEVTAFPPIMKQLV